MNEFPPVVFYFQLILTNTSGKEEVIFKEISGITMEMGVEEITEGGNNNFKHRVPTSLKYTNLVLKRGLASKDSEVVLWCMDAFNGISDVPIKTKNVLVRLLDNSGIILKSWQFSNAYPVKWMVSDLNFDNETVLIESLEFAYSYFQ
ncbi:phage tail protein [Aequorivita nionensis]|uniref:phage tail protein n=1 Tax=Aequorivita nionensis TaxID=1287690 RepID=UPI00396598AD